MFSFSNNVDVVVVHCTVVDVAWWFATLISVNMVSHFRIHLGSNSNHSGENQGAANFIWGFSAFSPPR